MFQGSPLDLTPPPAAVPTRQGFELLLEGWSSFANGWLIVDMCVVLLLALALGAVIAYHPSTRRRVSSLEHFEQPKTLLMYAVVAAVVALIVEVQPAMAFVIFGIGGLLRFRTMVGEAKDTGRVILVTVVGLCCGLKIFIVAVPATVIGWLLIFALEQQIAGIIRVSGVSEQTMQEATRAYHTLIDRARRLQGDRGPDEVHQARDHVRGPGSPVARSRQAPRAVRQPRTRAPRRRRLGTHLVTSRRLFARPRPALLGEPRDRRFLRGLR
jgi:hypothetical protein